VDLLSKSNKQFASSMWIRGVAEALLDSSTYLATPNVCRDTFSDY
jgi:hypothetical protein